MAAHIPPGGLNPHPKNATGTTFTQAPQFFNKPELRAKIVNILSQTANGCLKELNYHPQMAQEITDLKSRIDHYREENKKLYADNRQLLSTVRDAQNKFNTYSSTINRLEQQVAVLHKANQDILMRERNLALGNPAYSQLHSEYMRLSGYCVQLQQQIGALQKMVREKPTLQHPPGHIHQTYVVAEGGQPLPTMTSAAQGTMQKAQERLHRVQSLSSHRSISSQGRQSREIDPLPSASRPMVVSLPRPLNQPDFNNIASASQKQESALNPSAIRSSDGARIIASDAVGPATKIMGWVNEPSSYAAETRPRVQDSSSGAASLHHGRSASAQFHPLSSLSTPGSTVPHVNRNTPTSVIVRPPDVNVPPGMKFVPIGPPGRLLPPLAASVMKPASPVSRPPSVHAPSPSRTMSLPEPPTLVGAKKLAHLDTGVHTIDRSRTPNLTPTSSRNSAAPSEVELEATTPLDDHVNHNVKVVNSPVNEIGVENSVMVPEEATTASSLKRTSLAMQGDEDGNVSDNGENVCKRLRMSEDMPSQRNEDGKAIPTNSFLQALDEVTCDEEEEEEFGPDGKRCIGYCLAVFTEEDGDVILCSLCRLRQESGLISAPTIFPPDTTRETKIQHFLDEHPTAWENMINGKNCP